MTTVCQKCGVRGFEEFLVFCNKCRISAEHKYCLEEGPKLKEQEVLWFCEQCVTRVPKVDTPLATNTRERGKSAIRQRCGRGQSMLVDLLKRNLQKSCIANASSNVDKPLNGTSHCSKKDVLNVATMSKESKAVNIEQGDLLLHNERNDVHVRRENSECLGNDVEGRKMKKKRKLILDDESDEDASSWTHIDKFSDGVPYRSTTQLKKLHLPSLKNYSIDTAQPDRPLTESAAECYSSFPVNPNVRPVWRGFFNICDRKYGPVVAHLSNGACEKVCDVANMLPQVLHFERIPRLDAWPKSFTCSAPTEDNIALYFFPGYVRAKAVLEQLLDDVIKNDLTLKVTVHKAELLVFSSMLLPQRCHLFEGEPYLWGVFRGQQDSRLPMPPNTHCPRLSKAGGQVDEDQQYNAFKDVSTKCLNDEVKCDNDNNAFNGPQTPGGQVPDVSWGGSRSPGHRVPDQYSSRLNEVMEEPIGKSEDAHLMTRASRHHLPFESSGFVEVVNKPVVGTFISNMEFNLSGEYEGNVDSSLEACLELFPLGVEDLGVTAKVRGSDEVDIELGLETVKDMKYECKPALEEPVVFLFGKEIF